MAEHRPPLVATYSICACDLEAGQWGVATQSKFLAVGSVVPWAAPHVGAIATQAYANPRYGPAGLDLLRAGASADEVVEQLTAADDDRAQRQLGVVDAAGRGATFTGSECLDWAGGGQETATRPRGTSSSRPRRSTRMVDAFAATAGRPLAERLIDCLAAAQAAGGDRRGQQSAALLVVERDGGYAGLSDTLVDLRTDDHERPVEELRRLYRPPSRAVREDAARETGFRSTTRFAPRSRSGSAGSDMRRSTTGPASRTWRSGSTAPTASIPSCSRL